MTMGLSSCGISPKNGCKWLYVPGHWAFLRCFPVHWVICTSHFPRCTWSLYTGAECRQSAGFWSVRGDGVQLGEFRQLPKEIGIKNICTRGCAVLMSQDDPLAASNHLSCTMLRERSFILPTAQDEEFARHYRRLLEELKLSASGNLIAQDSDSLFL